MNSVGIGTLAAANVVNPVSISGKTLVGFENAEAKEQAIPPVEQSPASNTPLNSDSEDSPPNTTDNQRDQEIQQQIRLLAAREREVIAHEQAHSAVGGKYAGAPSFTYERGPDGVNYITGGEVAISLPTGGDDPAAILAAARQVRRAALAPADPSPQDRSVAAQASQLELQALADLAALEVEEQRAEQAEREDARVQAQQEEQQRQLEESEKRNAELDQSSRRSEFIGEQLITLDKLQLDQSVGTVVDQLA